MLVFRASALTQPFAAACVQGFTSTEAAARLQKYGRNMITEVKKRPMWYGTAPHRGLRAAPRSV